MAGSQLKSIAILGGGITGLTAAYRLTQRGHLVRLFEAGPAVGGVIRTERSDGWLVEAGPNSLQESPDLAGLLPELDLVGERVEAEPAAKNRYLVRGGRAHPLPHSPGGLFASPLFSGGAKLRILFELLSPRWNRPGDVALATLAREHFGREVADYGVQPAVSGVWAGDAARLSAREAFPAVWGLQASHGSLLRGAMAGAKARKARGESAQILSFRHGLQTLPAALAARLPPHTIVLNARVERLWPGARWRVGLRAPAPAVDESFDAVVSTLPAGPLASLRFGETGAQPLASLAAIAHPPLSSLFLGYRRGQVAHPLDGFGLLVPAVERRSVLGILFSSSLFPGRAPAGHVALTVLAGGMLQPDVARLSTAELLARVQPDLAAFLGASGEPVFLRHHFWPRAIPQYHLGHEQHRATLAACERAHPDLFLGGQVCDGISLPQCLAAGRSLAERAGRSF